MLLPREFCVCRAKGCPLVELRGCGRSPWDDAAQEMGETSTNYFALALQILALLSLGYLTGLVSPVQMDLKTLGRNLCSINIIPEREPDESREINALQGGVVWCCKGQGRAIFSDMVIYTRRNSTAIK